MWVITRLLAGNKEWYSSDNTRNFWMGNTGIWQNLFNPKYYRLFISEIEGYNYLESKVRPQYLDSSNYSVEEVKIMDHALYCITRTPTAKAKRDKISDLQTADAKEYWSKNGSSSYWCDHFSGEFTRKFTSEKKANEMAQNIRAGTVLGHFSIKVEEVK